LNRPVACFPGSGLPCFREKAPRSRPACRLRFVPEVEQLEDRIALTAFTMTSPVSRGELPSSVTAVGGIVLDLVGANGRRVVSELPASALFRGTFADGSPAAFRGNPGTIGIQTGFTPETVGLLGGGLAEAAVRLTLFDGDTAAGNFDFHDNELLLNDVPLGDFSDVATQETSPDGQTALSDQPRAGFRNDSLATGFFYSAAPDVLAALFARLSASGEVVYRLRDADPFDNFFDFTRGVEGGLADAGRPPAVVNAPPVIASVSNDRPVAEGEPVHVAVTATDPDGPAQPLTYEFDFDNDGTFETAGADAVALHTFADEGTYVIPVRVRDADGGEATGTTTVAVRNAPPRLEQVSLASRARVGDPVTLVVRFTDPGTADTFTLRVDWGGTTTTALLPAGSSVHVETRVLEGPPGEFPVTVTLTDNGGGEAVAVASVRLEGPPPAQQPTIGTAAAPRDARALLTAVLGAGASAWNVGLPAAAPGRVVPSVTATRIDAILLPAPPLSTTLIPAGGEGDQPGGEHLARSPPPANVPETPAPSGRWLPDWLAALLDQALEDGPAERPGVAPAAAAVDRPGLADPGQRDWPTNAPVPQVAVATGRTGPAVRVVVPLLAVLLLLGRWSAGQRFMFDTLRRRLRRKMAAFKRSQGG
jgi:PKD repeat protein